FVHPEEQTGNPFDLAMLLRATNQLRVGAQIQIRIERLGWRCRNCYAVDSLTDIFRINMAATEEVIQLAEIQTTGSLDNTTSPPSTTFNGFLCTAIPHKFTG